MKVHSNNLFGSSLDLWKDQSIVLGTPVASPSSGHSFQLKNQPKKAQNRPFFWYHFKFKQKIIRWPEPANISQEESLMISKDQSALLGSIRALTGRSTNFKNRPKFIKKIMSNSFLLQKDATFSMKIRFHHVVLSMNKGLHLGRHNSPFSFVNFDKFQ